MFSNEQNQIITRINNIINAIHGDINRYRISILPNQFNRTISIIISDLALNQVIYKNTMQTDSSNYIELINILRNIFMMYGAMISKLSSFEDKKTIRYYQQEIYLKNLEMSIKINNPKEELEALKAHRQIITQNFVELYKVKTKTIQ